MSRELEYRYCVECSGELIVRILTPGEPERLVCSRCGRIHHLDPKLTSCGLLTRNGSVLLVRRTRPPARNRWCVPGGFVDRGETLEAAAVREVLEETGLQTEVRSLYGLYSYSGYPVVVAIYDMEIRAGVLIPNEDECSAARWFSPEEIPWDQLAFQSTVDAVRQWVSSLNDSENQSPAG